MKKILVLALAGAVLGLGALAQPVAQEPKKGAALPPAEDEIKLMQSAFGEVIDFFSAFITEIKGAIADLRAEDDEFQAKYQALTVQLKDLEAKIIQLKMVCDQVPGLSDRVASLEETAKSLADKASANAAAISDIRLKLSKLDQGLAALKEEFNARIAALKADLGKKYTDLADKTAAAIEALRKEFADKYAQLSAQVDDHEKRIKRLEDQDLGKLQRRVLALEQAVQALQAKIENNRTKIESFEATLADLSGKVKAASGDIAKMKLRMDEVETALAAFEDDTKAQFEHLQGAVNGAQGMAILALLVALGSLALYFLGGAGG